MTGIVTLWAFTLFALGAGLSYAVHVEASGEFTLTIAVAVLAFLCAGGAALAGILLGFWEFVRGDHPRWRAGVLVTLNALILVGFVILAAIGSD